MMIPVPKHQEHEKLPNMESDDERIKRYLDVPPWKCPQCNLNNFGRNQRCASCRREK